MENLLSWFVSNQAMGKAYNELKQGEPAIERLFDLTSFKSKVCPILHHIGYCDQFYFYFDSLCFSIRIMTSKFFNLG